MSGHDHYFGSDAGSCAKHGPYMDGVCMQCAEERRRKKFQDEQIEKAAADTSRKKAEAAATKRLQKEEKKAEAGKQARNARRNKPGPSKMVNMWSSIINWTIYLLFIIWVFL